ncbi:MAG: hypothetical protein GXO32_06565 [Crenarchaeota archaeon]|nr:hypothetical protein [Thermoproteota archaeon]
MIDREWRRFHRDYLSRVRAVAHWLSIAHMTAIPPYRRLVGTQMKRILIWKLASCITQPEQSAWCNGELREEIAKLADDLADVLEAINGIIATPYKMFYEIYTGQAAMGKDSGEKGTIPLQLQLAGGLPLPVPEPGQEDRQSSPYPKVERLVRYLYEIHENPQLGQTFLCSMTRTIVVGHWPRERAIKEAVKDIAREDEKADKGIIEKELREFIAKKVDLNSASLCNLRITIPGGECRVSLLHALLYPRGERYKYIMNYLLSKCSSVLGDSKSSSDGDVIREVESWARGATLLVYLSDTLNNIINLLIFITKFKFVGSLLGLITTITNMLPEVLSDLHKLRCTLEPGANDCEHEAGHERSLSSLSPSVVRHNLTRILDDFLLSIEAFYAALNLHIFTHIYYKAQTSTNNNAKTPKFEFYTWGDETTTFRGPEVPCCLFRVDLKYSPTKPGAGKSPNTFFYHEFIPNYLCLIHSAITEQPRKDCGILANLATDPSRLLIRIPRFAYVESESAPSASVRDLLNKLYQDVRAGQSISHADHQQLSIHTQEVQNMTFTKNFAFQLMLDAVMSQLYTVTNQDVRRHKLLQTLKSIITDDYKRDDDRFYMHFNHYYYHWIEETIRLRLQYLKGGNDDQKHPGISKLIQEELEILQRYDNIPPVRHTIKIADIILEDILDKTINLAESYLKLTHQFSKLSGDIASVSYEKNDPFRGKELEDINDYTLLTLASTRQDQEPKSLPLSFVDSIHFAIQSGQVYYEFARIWRQMVLRKLAKEERSGIPDILLDPPTSPEEFSKLFFFVLTHSFPVKIDASIENVIRQKIENKLTKALNNNLRNKCDIKLRVNINLPSAGAMKLGYHRPDRPAASFQRKPEVQVYLDELQKKIHFLIMVSVLVETTPNNDRNSLDCYRRHAKIVKWISAHRQEIYYITIRTLAEYYNDYVSQYMQHARIYPL